MKSRIGAILSVIALAGGVGGAAAIAAGTSQTGASSGAANSQYKPGKGCGDPNHTHTTDNCPNH